DDAGAAADPRGPRHRALRPGHAGGSGCAACGCAADGGRRQRGAGRDAMNFAHFFIERPVFAGVLSIVTIIAGALAVFALPIAQYPEIAPPTVIITTQYPGANAKTVADTVSTPIEEQVNGVERMMYMSSQCNNDGSMRL